MRTIGLGFAVAVSATVVLVRASVALAPPTVPLPPSPVTTISTVSQELIAVALPRGESGLRWRIARAYDRTTLHPLLVTHDVDSLTVFVFVAARPGVTDLRFALMNGAGGPAYRAARYHVAVAARR